MDVPQSHAITWDTRAEQGGKLGCVQDTVAGAGRKGTRPQCVAAARRALVGGCGALIDRCNFDADQRRDFVALARELQCQARCWQSANAASAAMPCRATCLPVRRACCVTDSDRRDTDLQAFQVARICHPYDGAHHCDFFGPQQYLPPDPQAAAGQLSLQCRAFDTFAASMRRRTRSC